MAHQHQNCHVQQSVKFFFEIKLFIFGRFDPVNIFLMLKITNFRGDSGDISAKTATLTASFELCVDPYF